MFCRKRPTSRTDAGEEDEQQTNTHTKKNTLVGGFRVDNVDIYMVVMEKIINLAQMSSLAIAPGISTRKRRKQIRPVAFRPRVRVRTRALNLFNRNKPLPWSVEFGASVVCVTEVMRCANVMLFG